jgi:hypothetical protein
MHRLNEDIANASTHMSTQKASFHGLEECWSKEMHTPRASGRTVYHEELQMTCMRARRATESIPGTRAATRFVYFARCMCVTFFQESVPQAGRRPLMPID